MATMTEDEIRQTETADPKIIKKLFKRTMKGKWDEVKKIYEQHPEVGSAKITRSGDTALHIAAADGQEKFVEDIVQLVDRKKVDIKVLGIRNDQDNTPLHLAAALGSVKMCTLIAKKDPELIGVRNRERETPFFVTVLNGKKPAFLCLHQICGSKKGYGYCRKKGGDTILHYAISGEYFDLAFQIIHGYKKLVNYANEEGVTPLHVLANKPPVFKSCSHFGWFGKIIYACTFVDNLKLELEEVKQEAKTRENNFFRRLSDKSANYPKNYETCCDFPLSLMNFFYLCYGKGSKSEKKKELESQTQVKWFPPTYNVCFDTVKFTSKALLIMLGIGSRNIRKIQQKKEKHTWSIQIMNLLLEQSVAYEYDDNGRRPKTEERPVGEDPFGLDFDKQGSFQAPPLGPGIDKQVGGGETCKRQRREVVEKLVDLFPGAKNEKSELVAAVEKVLDRQEEEKVKEETPILIAAKNGITEMVEKILDHFPVAIYDVNSEKKNAVLLAVEIRHPDVYKLLDKRDILKDSIFRQVDRDGNSALHLAAKLGEHPSWMIPGAALQLQWEIKWYEFVEDSMPVHFFPRHNFEGQTAQDVFTNTHKELVNSGGEWLTNTSESCSVVAALIATVAFATASTVPGGVKESGTPTLENQPAFDIFAISSLVALCFSVTALVMFLSILTSRYQESDFRTSLPWKLLVGLTTLFVSIGSILVSFCAGHFFVLKDKLRYAAFPIYAVTCLPVTFFAIAQFPLYIDLILATATKVPRRGFKILTP